MNNDFYIFNQMFARRRKNLHQIALKQIEDEDYRTLDAKTIQDINLAIFDNNTTDAQLLGRYI